MSSKTAVAATVATVATGKKEERPFRERHVLDQRKEESKRILAKYPDRIPVIIAHDKRDKSGVPDIDKEKFLVPKDLTAGQLLYVVRKRMGGQLLPSTALFMFLPNDTLPASSALLSGMFQEHKDEDGFLYVRYSGQDTFG